MKARAATRFSTACGNKLLRRVSRHLFLPVTAALPAVMAVMLPAERMEPESMGFALRLTACAWAERSSPTPAILASTGAPAILQALRLCPQLYPGAGME